MSYGEFQGKYAKKNGVKSHHEQSADFDENEFLYELEQGLLADDSKEIMESNESATYP